MTKFEAWISAIRPRTLFLAVGTAVCGSGLAYFAGSFKYSVFLLTILIATLLQALSNMANDLGDYEKGTDTTGERLGPKRTVQSGAISPKEMKQGILLVILLSMFVGSMLVITALQFLSIWYVLGFLLLGAAAIWAAVRYTTGSNPYGYNGLGDLFSFVFFGPVPVIGTYFLHTQQLDSFAVAAAIGLGFLSAAVLNINNMRDLENDKVSGKKTIPVYLGLNRAKVYHSLLTIGAFLCFAYYSFVYLSFWYQNLYLLMFIPLFTILYKIIMTKENKDLDPYLKFTSMSSFFLALMFAIFINL